MLEVEAKYSPIVPFINKEHVMLTGARRLNWLGPSSEELFLDIYQKLMSFLEDGEEPLGDALPIILYIMCPGGEISPTFAFYDLLNYILSPRPNIIAIGTGMVASAAVITLLSVPKEQRFLTPNTMIYLHQSNAPIPDGAYSSTEVDGMNRSLKWGNTQYNEIIAYETGLSVRRIVSMRNKESIITPSDAKRWGFVQDILPLKRP